MRPPVRGVLRAEPLPPLGIQRGRRRDDGDGVLGAHRRVHQSAHGYSGEVLRLGNKSSFGNVRASWELKLLLSK